MKTYLNPFRLTTYLLILYCAGHTVGALVQTPHFGPGADAVLEAMKTTHFLANGSACTWYGFYLGFGYLVSIFFLFAAVVTWHLGGLAPPQQRAAAPLAGALFVAFAAGTYLAARWFFLPPVVFSSLITLLLGWQCLRLLRAPA